jgi:pimeloyl-ACP methyl ester carboxylesterase
MSSEEFVKSERARSELIIVLHGLSGSPRGMLGVIGSAAEARPNADVLALPLAYGGPFGILAVKPAERIAAQVAERIKLAIKARREEAEGEYERFILVGHSFGGVIARKVAIIARGERPDAPFGPLLKDFEEPLPWADKIERIVLLAGMSRGWSPEVARNWMTATGWTLGSWMGELLAVFSAGRLRPTISGIRQGAPFIVQTRLQWLALMKADERVARDRAADAAGSENAGLRDPRILGVQLLGAADDLVAPDDSVDFACDLSGWPEAPFVLIELPFATHDNAHKMAKPTLKQVDQIEAGIRQSNLAQVCKQYELAPQARWVLFGKAVSQSPPQLADIMINPKHMSDRIAAGHKSNACCARRSWNPRSRLLDPEDCANHQGGGGQGERGQAGARAPALSFGHRKLWVLRHGSVRASLDPPMEVRMAHGPLCGDPSPVPERGRLLCRAF